MGEPVGPEYTVGIPCPQCWGPGKPFGDVPTPKFVSITFTGLVGIWAPANHKWIGQQDPLMPCLWDFEDATFVGTYYFVPGITGVYLAFKPGLFPFIDFFGGDCDANVVG
ncbi:unnamed protein product [marine sediment metagenome]|uniref:Uncharacterized protein n=2 Tax=marine sediment metagenome TaxID=412755 RepID=X1K8Q8_9ZZZZ